MPSPNVAPSSSSSGAGKTLPSWLLAAQSSVRAFEETRKDQNAKLHDLSRALAATGTGSSVAGGSGGGLKNDATGRGGEGSSPNARMQLQTNGTTVDADGSGTANHLPADVLVVCFGYLTGTDIAQRCAPVCKLWREAVHTADDLWRDVFIRDFFHIPMRSKEIRDNKHMATSVPSGICNLFPPMAQLRRALTAGSAAASSSSSGRYDKCKAPRKEDPLLRPALQTALQHYHIREDSLTDVRAFRDHGGGNGATCSTCSTSASTSTSSSTQHLRSSSLTTTSNSVLKMKASHDDLVLQDTTTLGDVNIYLSAYRSWIEHFQSLKQCRNTEKTARIEQLRTFRWCADYLRMSASSARDLTEWFSTILDPIVEDETRNVSITWENGNCSNMEPTDDLRRATDNRSPRVKPVDICHLDYNIFPAALQRIVKADITAAEDGAVSDDEMIMSVHLSSQEKWRICEAWIDPKRATAWHTEQRESQMGLSQKSRGGRCYNFRLRDSNGLYRDETDALRVVHPRLVNPSEVGLSFWEDDALPKYDISPVPWTVFDRATSSSSSASSFSSKGQARRHNKFSSFYTRMLYVINALDLCSLFDEFRVHSGPELICNANEYDVITAATDVLTTLNLHHQPFFNFVTRRTELFSLGEDQDDIEGIHIE
ncbi:unnamed protein product, partial [Amoebophrya sp. A25]|eukprot:GSA25T00016958001.1